MKTITCDVCEKVLQKNDSRLSACVWYTRDEPHTHASCVIHENMDFCSSKCLKEFISIKLVERGFAL